MEGTVFLIGISHQIQSDTSRNNQTTKSFVDYISKKILELNIKILAEEYSEDACIIADVKQSTIQSLAIQYQLLHRYVDPGNIDREKLGIKSNQEILNSIDPSNYDNLAEIRDKELKKDFPKREGFWLERLADLTGSNIIFVCGSKHLESFSNLLTSNNIPNSILESRFESSSS